MIFTFLSFLALTPAFASDYTQGLIDQHKIAITPTECRNVESKLGQVLYATVYLKSPEDKNKTSNDEYFSAVKDLNLGGVLPHYYNMDGSTAGKTAFMQTIHDWNEKLENSARSPLYIGVDYVGSCGLGYGQGVLAIAPKACKKDFYNLQAACHAAYGVNHALGPTIERNDKNPFSQDIETLKKDAESLMDSFKQYGVATTLKHFPYTPESYNLHQQSSDTKLSKEVVQQKLENFAQLANSGADFTMSTHLYNSSVDPDDMATFSKTWVSYLRQYAKFDGILMTDALFMISSYKENMIAMSLKFDQAQFKQKLDDQSVFALRALIAGHDMVFLDGEVPTTRKVFQDLLYASCQNTPLAQQLRARILKSADKNANFKAARADSLRAHTPFHSEFLKNADELMQDARRTRVPDHVPDSLCEKIRTTVALFGPPPKALTSYKFPVESTQACDLNVNTHTASDLLQKVDQYMNQQSAAPTGAVHSN